MSYNTFALHKYRGDATERGPCGSIEGLLVCVAELIMHTMKVGVATEMIEHIVLIIALRLEMRRKWGQRCGSDCTISFKITQIFEAWIYRAC